MIAMHDEVDPGVGNSLSSIKVLLSRFLQSSHSLAFLLAQSFLCATDTPEAVAAIRDKPFAKSDLCFRISEHRNRELRIAKELHCQLEMRDRAVKGCPEVWRVQIQKDGKDEIQLLGLLYRFCEGGSSCLSMMKMERPPSSAQTARPQISETWGTNGVQTVSMSC